MLFSSVSDMYYIWDDNVCVYPPPSTAFLAATAGLSLWNYSHYDNNHHICHWLETKHTLLFNIDFLIWAHALILFMTV